ncbi:tRNA lysidine(34) synthetase TilS [Rhodococcus sp. IEGM 1366]|uniref:tRNA lysidine(34) synthetase TilS n=1 Tax=Rhodococcus sp. IEGM 1366 TaxID=3082223 RepID=UPI002952EFD7|nr:tRNA lysidine(34) synthetase TilS [Rhodococcus sp. IEGM 1366]MDV8067339.1 tRNA lysidine(34) synthetase TilS [Rhodococcus sp. IEGM 1366]
MRLALRGWLRCYHSHGRVCVALSGGADSLALTAAAVAEAESVDALIVDHRLQEGSDVVARAAADQALALGVRSARVLTVDVHGNGSLEAAARDARYEALDGSRGDAPVLLGHTLDDQAETVLLGLARGSGGRSIQGMQAFDDPWGRPLLGVRRGVTRAACEDLAITPWEDPHNTNDEFTRVRLRHEALPLLEEILAGGVAEALARTATQLREDGQVLDALAGAVLLRVVVDGEVEVDTLAESAGAIRRRVLRSWLLDSGAKALTDKQLRAVDALIADWRGQGGVAIGGGTPESRLVVVRRRGRLTVGFEDRRRV